MTASPAAVAASLLAALPADAGAAVVRRGIDGFLFQDDPRRIEFDNPFGERIIALFDEDKLSQALMNVLSNAFKYSRSRGGPITVTLARRHRRELVRPRRRPPLRSGGLHRLPGAPVR